MAGDEKIVDSGTRNLAFLEAVDAESKHAIISHIANHYAISNEDVISEVTDKEAELLVEYMIEPQRSATYALMQRHGFIN